MANASKHLKLSKVVKVKGVEVKLASKGNVSITFPCIAYPQYWDEAKQKFVTIENDLEMKQAIDRKEKLSYGGQILIKKDTEQSQKIKDVVDKLWAYYKLDKIKGSTRLAKYPLEDGDQKADDLEADEKNGDIYRGMWILKISSNYDDKKGKKRFKAFNKFDRSGNWMPSSNDEIQGYYVNLGLTFDFYDFGSNIGLKAYMNAIQFTDENPDLQFGTNYADADEFEFEEATEEEKEDALNKAIGEDSEDELPGGTNTPDVATDDDSPFA